MGRESTISGHSPAPPPSTSTARKDPIPPCCCKSWVDPAWPSQPPLTPLLLPDLVEEHRVSNLRFLLRCITRKQKWSSRTGPSSLSSNFLFFPLVEKQRNSPGKWDLQRNADNTLGSPHSVGWKRGKWICRLPQPPGWRAHCCVWPRDCKHSTQGHDKYVCMAETPPFPKCFQPIHLFPMLYPCDSYPAKGVTSCFPWSLGAGVTCHNLSQSPLNLLFSLAMA